MVLTQNLFLPWTKVLYNKPEGLQSKREWLIRVAPIQIPHCCLAVGVGPCLSPVSRLVVLSTQLYG